MKQDFPSFHFYPKDWLTGEATLAMTPEQLGAFIQLLAHAWNATPPCTLPDDDKLLADMSRMGKRWVKHGVPVKAQFAPAGGGRLRNGKLFDVYQEMLERRKRKSGAGQKGNLARWHEGSHSDRNAISDARDLRSPSVAVAVSSSASGEENLASSKSSSRRSSQESNGSNGDGWAPPWSEKQFQYKADKIAAWLKRKADGRLIPGTEDFDTEFEAEWGMSYDRWTELRPKCEMFFSARGAA